MPYTHTVKPLIGRGRLRVSENKVEWVDMGENVEFNVNITTEDKELYSSRKGLRKRLRLDPVQLDISGRIVTVDMHKRNLNFWFLGDGVTENTQAAGNTVDQNLVINVLDMWYPIGKQKISNLVVEDQAQTVTYVDNTDYEYDPDDGYIMALSTGSISAGDTILLTYDYAQDDYWEVQAGKSQQKKVHIHFRGENALSDVLDTDITVVGYANMKPDGDYNLIGEDYIQATFQIDFETHADYASLAIIRGFNV